MRQRSEIGEAALQLFSSASEPVIHDETDICRENRGVSKREREIEIHKGERDEWNGGNDRGSDRRRNRSGRIVNLISRGRSSKHFVID